MSSSIKRNKVKKWIIFVLVVLGFATVLYNFGYVKAVFYNFKDNHYNVGDGVSINDRSVSSSGHYIFIYQLIKNKATPYDIYWKHTPFSIRKDDLNMYKTNSLGTYIGYKIITLHPKTSSKFSLRFYAIKPNWKIVTNDGFQLNMRSGYTLLDDNYYLLVTP